MNETITETRFEEATVPPQGAQEAARVYEDAVDAPPESVTAPSLVSTGGAPENVAVPDPGNTSEDVLRAPRTTEPPATASAEDTPENMPSRTMAQGPTPPGPNIPSNAQAPRNGAPSGSISSSQESPGSSFRLRMKVWTDPKTRKIYLMPQAFFRDLLRGQPVSDVMYAYAMRDDNTQLVTLTMAEWNALPFFYFREDGWAPRPGERSGMIK